MSSGIFKVIGVILYLYLIWRGMREDYKDDDLIEFGWLSLLMMLIGGRIAFGILHWGMWNQDILDWWTFWSKPGFNIFGAIFAWNLVMIYYAGVKQIKFWVWGEDLWPKLATLMIFWLFDEWIRSRFVLTPLWLIVVWLVSAVVYWWGHKKYRSLQWYRSGKKGFALALVNIVWGLLMAGVGIVVGGGWWLATAGVIWSLLSAYGLVMLSHL